MDVSGYMDFFTAPRVVFRALPERAARVRFMVPTADGSGWRAITWQAFADEIREIGLFLSDCGLLRGERGAILGHNSVPWLSAALGIQAAGGVMVPIYPTNTPELIGYVVEHSDAKILFVGSSDVLEKVFEAWEKLQGLERIVALDDRLDAARVLQKMRDAKKPAPSFADVEPKFVTWSRARAIGRAAHAEDPERFERTMDAVPLAQPGVMLYTSGTTGLPKGVPLTHEMVGANGRDWLQCNASLLEEGYVDVLWLPLSHIFGFGEACLGNTLGWVTYWATPVDLLQKLPEVRPHIFMSVPRFFEKIATAAMAEETRAAQRAKLEEVTGGNFKFCLSGGAGLKQEIKEFLYDHGLLVLEGYGLTEASPTLTLNRPDDFRFDSVGKPLASVELKLAADGEILARGPNIFTGYHKDEEASRGAFTQDGWLKTGDIGQWTEDGFLKIVDRKKEILVTAGGKNIPPANIEVRFRDDPLVLHAVAYGDGKPFISAGIWLDADVLGAHLTARDATQGEARARAIEELVGGCVARANEGLARYESIRTFVVIEEPLTVESGLLTPTLKVKRKQVYERFAREFEALYNG
ncbi:MAG: AMP-binding protein [Myxococcota bacterium]